jgi:hypothetical protein
MRKPGYVAPTDRDHVVKISQDLWEKLGVESITRKISRPILAGILLDFMLDNADIIDDLLAEFDEECTEGEGEPCCIA